MSRLIAFLSIALLVVNSTAHARVLVEIQMDKQIDVGYGPAISGFDIFDSENGIRFARKLLLPNQGAGEWYYGPFVDLPKAGCGAYIDLSAPGTIFTYIARYYQGGGNSNPYGDAPIFVKATDINGRSRGFGISYGAQPDPAYPEWLICTVDLAAADWPNDPEFDLSKVKSISFFGTDWASAGDDYIDIRDILIADTTSYDTITVSQAKGEYDDEEVHVRGVASLVMKSAGMFYMQKEDRSAGIRVHWQGDMPCKGQSVIAVGVMKTDPDTRERYIDASDWVRNGRIWDIKPVGVTHNSLGGSQSQLQDGVYKGVGLNNIGLLVQVNGKVNSVDEENGFVYIDDGSQTTDGSGFEGVKIDLTAIPRQQRPAINKSERIFVTGASSTYSYDNLIHRMVRVGSRGDIYNPLDNGNRPRTFNVLVINFDPVVPSLNLRTSAACGWNDPHQLAARYVDDIEECSGGWAKYKVVEWIDANYHPRYEDGFQWSNQDYYDRWSTCGSGCADWHQGWADYAKIIADYNIAARVASGEIDEVFMFDGPYASGFYESRMAGPGAYWCNAPGMDNINSGRLFVMMGFNPERGVDCMLEDYGHRTESIMTHVYQGWNSNPPVTNWDFFSLYNKQIVDNNLDPAVYTAGCGNVHFSPNSDSDYDWGNTSTVWSTCDDWLDNWPNLLGTKKQVTLDQWGSGDQFLHHMWWFKHIPNKPGINPDGKQNNWWKYLAAMSEYAESR